MRDLRRVIAALGIAALLTLLGVSPAFADGARAAAADVLFREAVKLASAGDYAKAAEKFEASYELDASRGTLLGWAMAEEKAGKLAAALGHSRSLADQARAAKDEKRLKAASALVERLEGRVPTLVIVSEKTPSDGKVTLDQSPFPAGAFGSRIPVDPGPHTITASTVLGEVFTRKITLKEGEHVSVEIDWATASAAGAETSPPPRVTETPPPKARPAPTREAPPASGSSGLKTAGLILGAVGVVGMGVGGYLFLDAGRRYDDVMAQCSGNRCPERLASEIDSGRSQENLGRVLFVVGGVAAGAGVTLFILGGSGSEKPGALRASARPGSFALEGSF